MTEITPQKVKELREKTGAGMGDCKNALIEANGDMKIAIEILRKKGAASAAKRADRSANEGIILTRTSNDSKKGIIVEINCETDFVARNAEFVKYANIVADALLSNSVKSIDELLNIKVNDDTIQGLHNEILAKFSENISIRRFDIIETEGYVADYIHPGNRLGVLIEISAANPSEKVKTLTRDIAMQIAAMNPLFISRENCSQEKIDKELEIYKELAISEGKKPEIAERIARGKLEKFFQEQCLLEQTFVKDATKVVKDVVNEMSTENNGQINIISYKRYYLGESLD